MTDSRFFAGALFVLALAPLAGHPSARTEFSMAQVLSIYMACTIGRGS
jgi:hypothetical protein